MAAITDLTFNQVAAALGDTTAFFIGEDPLGNITLMVSISAVNGESTSNLNNDGVIKFCTRLLAACGKAQDALNVNQIDGEKLNSFPAASSSGVIVNGFVEQTSTLKSKIAVSTATEIVGTNI